MYIFRVLFEGESVRAHAMVHLPPEIDSPRSGIFTSEERLPVVCNICQLYNHTTNTNHIWFISSSCYSPIVKLWGYITVNLIDGFSQL
jgi:hypothetical protein